MTIKSRGNLLTGGADPCSELMKVTQQISRPAYPLSIILAEQVMVSGGGGLNSEPNKRASFL